MSPRTDDELLERWQAGDSTAGNELFLRYFKSIRRFFANKVPAEEVEDLVQRTFAGCVAARDRVRGDAGMRAFLFGVARRQLYKFLRERASRARMLAVDFGVSSIRGLGLSPSSMVAREQQHGLLLQALQRVSVDHQTILELYYWEQLSGPEIAEILGIAPATVRTRLFRARQAVEQAFAQLASDRGAAVADLENSLRELAG
ncbi:MAG TPA: sigma-70 family RNA polymerase sigma factor [Enhygromyxa sp.]|nr:sigma-70 family RNA polymerase sigma factor [Enhygromyxa sp.]